jgi:hypothetical protein
MTSRLSGPLHIGACADACAPSFRVREMTARAESVTMSPTRR